MKKIIKVCQLDKIISIVIIPVLFLTVVLSIFSCSKSGVTGEIVDSGGKPIEGVSVKIQNSTFSAVTDDQGKYSIEYVPGSFRVIFSKDGYTTHKLELNIADKTLFPAEIIVMYPIPQKKGIYYLDGNKIVNLTQHKVQEYRRELSWSKIRSRYYIDGDLKKNQEIQSGSARFIDTSPNDERFFHLRSDGTIQSFEYGFGDYEYIYKGIINDKEQSRVGDEKILLRTVYVEPGFYAWVEVVKTLSGNIRPGKDKTAFAFHVPRTPLSEKDKTDIQDLINVYSKLLAGTVDVSKESIDKILHFKDGKGATDLDVRGIAKELFGEDIDSINIVNINSSYRENKAVVEVELWEKGEMNMGDIRPVKIDGIWYIDEIPHYENAKE